MPRTAAVRLAVSLVPTGRTQLEGGGLPLSLIVRWRAHLLMWVVGVIHVVCVLRKAVRLRECGVDCRRRGDWIQELCDGRALVAVRVVEAIHDREGVRRRPGPLSGDREAAMKMGKKERE